MNRGRKCALAGFMAAVSTMLMVTSPAGASDPPPKGPLETLSDTVGEVLNSLVGTPLDDARGDITQASVEYGTGWIKLDVQVRQFTSPVKDPNWESDSTYALWSLDTNGDATTDYTVEYGISDGELYGSVYRPDAPADADQICDADSVTFGTSGLYAMVLNPECIGRPASFAWKVAMSYDTNTKDAKAPATDDVAPDKGFSAPVFAPASAPGPTAPPTAAALLTPTPAPTPAATGAPATPKVAPRPGAQPGSSVPPAVTKAPTAPQRATTTTPSGPTPALAAQAAIRADAAGAPAAPPSLARTGSNGRDLAILGAWLVTAGLLLQLLTERRTRRAPAAA